MNLTKTELALIRVIATCIITVLSILTQYYPGNMWIIMGIAFGASYGIHAIPAAMQVFPVKTRAVYLTRNPNTTPEGNNMVTDSQQPEDAQQPEQAPELLNPIGIHGAGLMGIAPPVQTATENQPEMIPVSGEPYQTGPAPETVTRDEFQQLVNRVESLETHHGSM